MANSSQQQPINYSNEATTTSSSASSTTPKGPVVFDDEIFLFLPRLGDILKSFEKNPTEIKTKVEDLRKQFESCQDVISRVEGIDTTIDDQRNELNRLDQELKSKTDLLKKHIQLCKFDLQMPTKPNRNSSENDEENLRHSNRLMNINDEIDEEEEENDVDDDELFHTDDQTHLHSDGTNEHFSTFFP